MIKRVLSSYLFWVAVVIAVFGINVVTLLLLLVAFLLNRRRFIYEATLPVGTILHKIDPVKYPTFNKITDSLYLGRIPLKNRDDHTRLKELGITSVLSVVEKFENHSVSLFSDPVTPDDWKGLNVSHLQIESRDFSPLSTSSIARGVQFIADEIGAGKKVYVHCKAGRTRSCAIIVAYLMKYFPEKFASVEEAIAYVRALRPIITLSEDKVERIKQYLAPMEPL